MDRRKFLRGVAAGVTVATAKFVSGVAYGTPPNPSSKRGQTVLYQVKGFTCVTCAIGLEATLLRMEGVLQAHASYPEATVSICFDEARTSESALRELIASCGFAVANPYADRSVANR